MDPTEILIRVSEGEDIDGYRVKCDGIDHRGRYKDIITPNGSVERVYCLGPKDLEKDFPDRYNRLHQYRRQGDTVVLYYHLQRREFAVVGVKPGDDLSKAPFLLPSELIVTEEMIAAPAFSEPCGIIPITHENLIRLQEMGALTEEMVFVLYYNRKNVGFYL